MPPPRCVISGSRRKERTVTRSWDLNDGAPPPDAWMWRKYGQKGFKGSPHVRSYYKCSTDKQCRARKHVERCTDDSRYLVVSYTGEHTHPAPLIRNIVTRNPRVVVNPAPPPPPVTNITVEAAAPAPSVTASLTPTAPALAPPTPFPKIPAAVEGPPQAPALPAFAAAASVSPTLKISAVEETRKAPAPPAIAASASLSPTTPLRSPPAVTMMIIHADMTPKEDSVLFAKRDDDKPQDGVPLPMPEELAPVHHGAPGGGGNYNMMFPATYGYEPAAGSSSSSGDGSTRTAPPVSAPIGNLVDETFYQLEPCLWCWP
ncbi:hypothetical protein PVAP13_4NG226600 [Panicum virgatum]|uniref:WRKY domain-containing protein n=2 Tax=Panicum virgatum TaxID=38727 RepID=A0A8T0T5M6_PANVG|nr:hypothetical protein PVAP13_4NG226600 [Panicum virgatum]